MTHQNDKIAKVMEVAGGTPPAVIVLGDAAVLTRGGENQSVEAKQSPYD